MAGMTPARPGPVIVAPDPGPQCSGCASLRDGSKSKISAILAMRLSTTPLENEMSPIGAPRRWYPAGEAGGTPRWRGSVGSMLDGRLSPHQTDDLVALRCKPISGPALDKMSKTD